MSLTRSLLPLLVVAAALPWAAAADPPQQGIVHVAVPRGTPPKQHGYQLYAANCLTCHGDRGRSVPEPRRGAGDLKGLGPPLTGVGALAPDFYLRTGYMPLRDVGAQPVRSRVLFSEREIRALVAYVASLGKGPSIPKPHPERGDPSEGMRLFTDHCAGCHQIVGKGGLATGALVPPLGRATDRQIAEAVRIGPFVMPTFSKKQISDRELDSIIGYIDRSKHPADPGGWAIGHIGPIPEGLVTWLMAAVALVAVCLAIGRRLRS